MLLHRPLLGLDAVLDPVTVAGRPVAGGEQFTRDVSAEEMFERETFKRELIVGHFSATDEVDYRDPRAG